MPYCELGSGHTIRPARNPNGFTSMHLISKFYTIPVGFAPQERGGLATHQSGRLSTWRSLHRSVGVWSIILSDSGQRAVRSTGGGGLEINSMEVGPEMDALIAEILGYKVLGIVLCEPSHDSNGYIIPYWPEGTVFRPVFLRDCICNLRQPSDIDYFGHSAGCLEVIPEYSEDDCHVLTILKKYPIWVAEVDPFRENLIVWRLSLNNYEWVFGEGKTIALAICRALLQMNFKKNLKNA